MVYAYYPRGNEEKDQHNGICTLKVLNLILYKQYVRKTTKLLYKYIKYTLHPRSLDGTSPPLEEMLHEFGILEVILC